MARLRRLTEEQRRVNDALCKVKWREKNKVVEKLRARNNRKKAKGELEEAPEPIKIQPVRKVEETHLESWDKVEGWEPVGDDW
jgi:hypothetical protein